MQPFLFLRNNEQLFKLFSLLVLSVFAALVTVLVDWEGSFASLFFKLLIVFVH